jgi:hypothetical protein
VSSDLYDGGRWLIVAFPPGAYGHRLGKWLVNNQIARIFNGYTQLDYSEPDNHNYQGYYSDTMFSENLSNELIQHPNNRDKIYKLLDLSNYKPIDLSDKYNLILTHYPTFRSLYELKLIFKNSKVIRITFNNQEQAQQTLSRKRILVNDTYDINKDLGNLCDNYFPFLYNYNFCINVPIDRVINLDLDFLKELL